MWNEWKHKVEKNLAGVLEALKVKSVLKFSGDPDR